MRYGRDEGVGNFFEDENGLFRGSLPAVNPMAADTTWAIEGALLEDGFTWLQYGPLRLRLFRRGSRRRRGDDVDIPWRRVAAPPRRRRG